MTKEYLGGIRIHNIYLAVAKKDFKKIVVTLNKPVQVRFSDGEELWIRIYDQKPQQTSGSVEYFIYKDTPAAKALLGHSMGEKVEYAVGENLLQVQILQIK